MAKIHPISGFPEWLPEERLVEQAFLDEIRSRFESYGFAPLETRAVEPLDQLLKKGETDKEIYVLRRLHADGDSDSGLGLHFDLTVPFARYVQQFQGQLAFPFKRYQIQKVWRGERPQDGRFREFYQADIDVVDRDDLSLAFDAEMPRLLHEILSSLPLPPFTIGINDRKLLEGAYRDLGIEDLTATLRIVDKLAKIGPDGVRKILTEREGLSETVADTCLALGRIRTDDASFADQVRGLGLSGDLLEQGLSDLTFVMESLADLPAGSVRADLSIARGLDYYTGTVYEGVMVGHEDLGTVCSGGRYDDLCGAGSKLRLPGVGVSIGVSRILSRLLGEGLLDVTRRTPTAVLVTLPDAESRSLAAGVANGLRERGVPTELFHEPVRFGKQIKYAQKRGIPYVWFPPAAGTNDDPRAGHEVKDIRSGEQCAADPATWAPPAADLRPRLVRGE